ncbi:hypothetical protein ES703_88369 [subsurface metagenome]
MHYTGKLHVDACLHFLGRLFSKGQGQNLPYANVITGEDYVAEPFSQHPCFACTRARSNNHIPVAVKGAVLLKCQTILHR